jgi:hypothetical protein
VNFDAGKCSENLSMKYRAVLGENLSTVAGDIYSPQKYCYGTFAIFVFLTVACSWAKHRKRVVAFSLQPFLRERVAVLGWTCIACFVELNVVMSGFITVCFFNPFGPVFTSRGSFSQNR